MNSIYALAAAGVLLTAAGFAIYNYREGRINSTSWFLWVIGDVLEAGTYFVMTGEDLLKNSVPIAFAIGSCITFVVALVRRRFGVPDAIDRGVLLVDISITVGWWQRVYGAAAANIMLVATEFLSFIPLYRGVLSGEEKETWAPWLLWAMGDILFLVTVLSLVHKIEEVVYPAVQAVAHLLVIACIFLRRPR